MRSTRLLVDCSRIKHNITEFRNLISPDANIMAVVKANAYGHGMAEVARYALEYGATWLGVATPEEGVYLRKKGVAAPMLVFGASNGEELSLCVEYGLHQAVFNEQQIFELNNIGVQMGKTALVHIKVNTGMNRIGVCDEGEFAELLDAIKQCKHIDADGIFTHFACADEENDIKTYKQIERFEKMLAIARSKGVSFKHIHACNTAGALRGLCKEYSMIRLGIGLYGYYPSEYMKKTSSAELLPVGRFVTNISAVNTIHKGDEVSYGGTFTAECDMQVATLPVGYADGFSRKLSDEGYAVICGKKAKILGRVCMDQFMADISHIPEAGVGTDALLMGENAMTADDMAEICDTISYEILTSIARRVERVYINDKG